MLAGSGLHGELPYLTGRRVRRRAALLGVDGTGCVALLTAVGDLVDCLGGGLVPDDGCGKVAHEAVHRGAGRVGWV